MTSPSRHSMILCGPAPRSTDIAMRPDSTTNMPLTCVALRRQHVAGMQLSKGPVRGQPRQFLARRPGKRPVLRQPIDQIRCCHLCAARSVGSATANQEDIRENIVNI